MTNRNIQSFNFGVQYQPIKSNDFSKKSDKYVLWGTRNEYPKVLMNALEKSIIHKQIINSIAEQVFGKGFILTSSNTEILSRANDTGENWNDILQRCAMDYVIFGRFALIVNYDVRHTNIVNIYHQNFSEVAIEKANPETDTIENFYTSKDWSIMNAKFIKYPNFLNQEKADTMMYVYTPYSPSADYFPKPSYASDALLNVVELQWEMNNYKVMGFKNKWSAGMAINMVGEPTEEEREQVERNLKQSFTGAENAQTLVLTFSPDKDSAPTIQPIPTSTQDYGNFVEEATQEVINAHNVTDPILVGLGSANGFSNNADQLKTSFEVFYKQTIEPKQVKLQRVFTTMFRLAGGTEDLVIDKILPFDITSTPVSQITPNITN
jgi:hypothetical protein